MNKKNILILLILVLGTFQSIVAQTIQQKKILGAMSLEMADKNVATYNRTIDIAKQKNWPLTITLKNGNKSVLKAIDNFGLPLYLTTFNNTIAAATTSANQLWPGGSSGLNLSGSSNAVKNKLAIWDGGGVLTTHVELTGRVLQKDASTAIDHATHVAGTMIASGVNPIAKGMAYGLQQLIAYDAFQNYTNGFLSQMTSEAANGLLLSNHSYGDISGWRYNSSVTPNRWEFWGRFGETEDYKFGYYSFDAQSLDSIVYNAPHYLPVFSAGNNRGETGPAVGQPYYRFSNSGSMDSAGNRPSGISSNDSYGSIPTYGNAKNILTVGAVNGLSTGYSKTTDVVMSSFSSWGPTDDGRIKPDVVADGVNVTSSISTSNTAYATFSGTSMASPNTTGSLLLLQEYYNKLHPGTFLNSASLKALAIHTADEAGASPGPDYQFGWGLLNVLKASNIITANNSGNYYLYEDSLNNSSRTLDSFVVVASGQSALKATIVWVDPPANVEQVNVLNNTTPKLMNDLDLRIYKGTTNSTTIYKPWVLNPAIPSNAATKADNILDNVERVDVDSVVPGQTYTITVSHKGNLVRGIQKFSLTFSGVGGTAFCTSSATSITAGAAIDSVVFAGIANKNTSNLGYNDYTNLSANIEAAQTIPMTVSVRTRDASSNPRIVRAYIDYNGNGIFESNEKVAESAVINAATSTANFSITTSPNVTIGNILLMRIIVQETSNANDINACGTYAVGETEDFKLTIISPSNDVAVTEIVSPSIGACSNAAQFLTVRIRNNGSIDKTNIPLFAIIKNGTTTLASFSANYPEPILANSEILYTFQTTFTTVANTVYTISVSSNIVDDQNKSNDTLTQNVTIAPTQIIAGTAEICGTNAFLRVTNPNASSNYFWYTSPTGPIISKATAVNIATITSDKNYYLSSGFKGSVGLQNKNVFAGGGYNNFAGNYVNISASVPVTIDYAKLYIGNPGPITFAVADLSNVTASSYNYVTLSSTTIDAYATTPTATPPTGNTANPDVAADSGAYYYLNLTVPAGNHAIIINPNISVNTTIFRNYNATKTFYPQSISNVFSITGNSVQSPSNFQNYYYFFYDMKISTTDCLSDKITIAATTAPVPTITQVADSLVSNIASGNQWYFNNLIINGASGKSYKPTQSGNYSVTVTDAVNCSQTSAAFNFIVTAIQNVSESEIGLEVSPNPNHGQFNVSFYLKTKANVTVELLNDLGQKTFSNFYSNFSGQFNQQFNTNSFASGTYILKVQQNGKIYRKRIIIVK